LTKAGKKQLEAETKRWDRISCRETGETLLRSERESLRNQAATGV
jgi:hypothetical protein